jgi:CRP-like cAMP-binding protein
MADDITLEGLSRGQLLKLAAQLTERASELDAATSRTLNPKAPGSPKDPAVRRLAAMQMAHLHEVLGLTFQEIGDRLSISRERAFQLYKDLVGEETREEANNH